MGVRWYPGAVFLFFLTFAAQPYSPPAVHAASWCVHPEVQEDVDRRMPCAEGACPWRTCFAPVIDPAFQPSPKHCPAPSPAPAPARDRGPMPMSHAPSNAPNALAAADPSAFCASAVPNTRSGGLQVDAAMRPLASLCRAPHLPRQPAASFWPTRLHPHTMQPFSAARLYRMLGHRLCCPAQNHSECCDDSWGGATSSPAQQDIAVCGAPLLNVAVLTFLFPTAVLHQG